MSRKIQEEPVDLGLLYAALKTDRINLAAATATDGILGHPEFVMLEDDRHDFPPCECAIAVSTWK
jgi:osmoprotectant transport system substrate-binding protein